MELFFIPTFATLFLGIFIGVSYLYFQFGRDKFLLLKMYFERLKKDSLTFYRYGYNGKEKDNDMGNVNGAIYDYGFRIYDSRIAKFTSVDPLAPQFPYYTPYQYAGNKPIWATDLDGLEEDKTNDGACSSGGCTALPTPDYGSSPIPEADLVYLPESSQWSWIGKGDIGNNQQGVGSFNVGDTWYDYNSEKKWYYDDKGTAYNEGSYGDGYGNTFSPSWDGADKAFNDFKSFVWNVTGSRGPQKAIVEPIQDWWDASGQHADYWTGYWSLSSYQKGLQDGGTATGLVNGLPTLVMTYGAAKGLGRFTPSVSASSLDIGLSMALTTEDGFLFGKLTFRTPVGFKAQRFGYMKESAGAVDYWGPVLGNSSFVGRGLNAIWPHWNDLSKYTVGYVPAGTKISIGFAGPQSFRFGLIGGAPQFLLNSSSVIKN